MPYTDKEKQKLYWREYQRSDARKAYKRAWSQKNSESINAKRREKQAKDPSIHKAYFRNHHILKTYGITTEQYEEMFQKQGCVCAICGSPPDIKRHGIARLAIDHCHKSGKIRGLLCNNCNAGIGIIGDTVKALEAALAYLKKFEEQ